MRRELERAVQEGADTRRYARVLTDIHDAVLSGATPPARPREVIGASWERVRRYGVDPDHGRAPAPLPHEEVEQRRNGTRIAEVLPTLRDGLVGVADDAEHIMVVTDAEGQVLWRDGSTPVRRRADGLGFVEGASWREDRVGTNAIGTALAIQCPVQVYSAEHYVRSHHPWTCAAAPVHDPRDGSLLGIIDVSGPTETVHPNTLALVDAVTRLAELELRTAHRRDLDRLRVVGLPVLARLDGPALVADLHGWVAAAYGLEPVDRMTLPAAPPVDGHAWLPSLGPCAMEPLPGGWLVRPDPGGGAPAGGRLVLDLRDPSRYGLSYTGPGGYWTYRLTPRHAAILRVLAEHPDGRTATELAADLFGDPARTVTVRAEMSRLRRHLGGLLNHRPYRIRDGLAITVLGGKEGLR